MLGSGEEVERLRQRWNDGHLEDRHVDDRFGPVRVGDLGSVERVEVVPFAAKKEAICVWAMRAIALTFASFAMIAFSMNTYG